MILSDEDLVFVKRWWWPRLLFRCGGGGSQQVCPSFQPCLVVPQLSLPSLWCGRCLLLRANNGCHINGVGAGFDSALVTNRYCNQYVSRSHVNEWCLDPVINCYLLDLDSFIIYFAASKRMSTDGINRWPIVACLLCYQKKTVSFNPAYSLQFFEVCYWPCKGMWIDSMKELVHDLYLLDNFNIVVKVLCFLMVFWPCPLYVFVRSLSNIVYGLLVGDRVVKLGCYTDYSGDVSLGFFPTFFDSNEQWKKLGHLFMARIYHSANNPFFSLYYSFRLALPLALLFRFITGCCDALAGLVLAKSSSCRSTKFVLVLFPLADIRMAVDVLHLGRVHCFRRPACPVELLVVPCVVPVFLPLEGDAIRLRILVVTMKGVVSRLFFLGHLFWPLVFFTFLLFSFTLLSRLYNPLLGWLSSLFNWLTIAFWPLSRVCNPNSSWFIPLTLDPLGVG